MTAMLLGGITVSEDLFDHFKPLQTMLSSF